MKTHSRRQFIQSTATATVAAVSAPTLLALEANNAFRDNIGLQIYTLRNQLGKDTPGTIKAVAKAGYKQVEPYGFPNGYAIKMIEAAKDNGLGVNSSHFDWESVTNPEKEGVRPWGEVLEQAKKHGLTHLVIPYIHGHNRKTLDDYKRLAERCNKGAVEAQKAGIQLAYHNHAFEFEPKKDGKSGYDIFVEEFAPEMKFEIDVFWVKVGNVDPVDLMKKLKGRVSQLHLKDLKKDQKLPSYGGVGKEAFKELGAGMIPMEPIIVAAKDAGVAHCHVEQDHSPNPVKSIQQSIAHLKTL